MTLPRPCPGPRAGSNQSAHHSHTLPDVLCRLRPLGSQLCMGSRRANTKDCSLVTA